jgi:hypothetical protein
MTNGKGLSQEWGSREYDSIAHVFDSITHIPGHLLGSFTTGSMYYSNDSLTFKHYRKITNDTIIEKIKPRPMWNSALSYLNFKVSTLDWGEFDLNEILKDSINQIEFKIDTSFYIWNGNNRPQGSTINFSNGKLHMLFFEKDRPTSFGNIDMRVIAENKKDTLLPKIALGFEYTFNPNIVNNVYSYEKNPGDTLNMSVMVANLVNGNYTEQLANYDTTLMTLIRKKDEIIKLDFRNICPESNCAIFIQSGWLDASIWTGKNSVELLMTNFTFYIKPNKKSNLKSALLNDIVTNIKVTAHSKIKDINDISNNISLKIKNSNNETGVEKTISSLESIFPNPFDETLNIKGIYGKIVISDIIGKIVLIKDIRNNTTLDVSGLKKGIYFLNIGSTTFKIIKR